MAKDTNSRERLQMVLAGEKPDRVPVALWRHFPVDDQDPMRLAEAAVAFQRLYDFDLIKVTFASSYFVRDWGIVDRWDGSTEGTRTYIKTMIQDPGDWLRLQEQNMSSGFLADQVECMRMIRENLGPDAVLLPTIFSPLSQARKLVGDDKIHIHMRQYPKALHEGLKIIANETIRLFEAMRSVKIDGIFYAVQHTQIAQYSEAEHLAFGRPYDLDVLDTAKGWWLNMLHVHGKHIMFDKVLDYPVQVLNWHDRETSPNLSQGLEIFSGVVCGGLSRTSTMLLGSPENIYEEAIDAINQTAGRRFILGTGCVLPITVPHGNILAARDVVDSVEIQ